MKIMTKKKLHEIEVCLTALQIMANNAKDLETSIKATEACVHIAEQFGLDMVTAVKYSVDALTIEREKERVPIKAVKKEDT